ncbi:helix-turn-helix transcriptional regulator [Amycolatopsis jejuensis]|uniref:helix-turn-helix transcriptional regulator n=1 Tax=Amycolatopsis jejuensis TaxID=330084 RepID=UPI00052610EB|nr:AraC family transcriptional regulator [Amycolatopsis jejuensis]
MRGTTVAPGTACAPVGAGELPLHRLEVPGPGAMPFAVGTFDAVGPLSRAAFPHRHTFHEIVLVTGGSGAHVVDLTRWPLQPPQFGVVTPGQVHHWEARGLTGSLVLFTDDFLLDHPADRETLRRLRDRPWLPLDEPEGSRTARLIAELEEEFRRGGADSESVLRALLHVLIVRAGRLPGTPATPARARAVAAEFAELAEQPELGLWSVRAHAERLGVTPGYLTEAVKAATGRTAAELVREARTGEAKRFLLRTDLSVRQIASRVGFADPAYFCRFFRRETGLSPGGFRRTGDTAPEIHHDCRPPSIARG